MPAFSELRRSGSASLAVGRAWLSGAGQPVLSRLVRQVAFEIPEPVLDDLLDALLAELPHGIRDRAGGEGRRRLEAIGLDGQLPDRTAFEAAAGVALVDWVESEVPADIAGRRVPIPIGGRLLVRAPNDPPAGEGMLDVVLERVHGGYGSGSHPTTRMCLELLLGLAPQGAIADLGCGLGVLAIAAARLGWNPVVAIDHDDAALEVARRNARLNAVEIEFVQADLAEHDLGGPPTLLANLPGPLHLGIAGRLPQTARRVVVAGVPVTEAEAVLAAYARAGFTAVTRIETGFWVAAVHERV